jgi:uncharacterized repeat protein (TIGR01451 family)
MLAGNLLVAGNVTLNSSLNPSNYGQPVTLTASLPSGVTGKVTFYDGINVLGSGIVIGASASLTTTMLPTGTRSLRAYYLGDNANAAATSAVLSQSVMPVASLGLKAAVNFPAAPSPQLIAVADFNGDGKPDVVVANYGFNAVGVLLGKGDGTFGAAAQSPIGNYPTGMAVGDFNGDGNADLAMPVGSGAINVLLGKGDGTFQAAISSSAGSGPAALAVGDFNGDGKTDLAVASTTSNSMRILLGNGDGTFQQPVNYAGSPTYAVAIGDFNGDGKADLAFLNYGSVFVLLGNGDGTFRQPVAYTTTSSTASLTIGDFNGDGKPDLVVCSSGYPGLTQVLLGNGDGTFQSALSTSLASFPTASTAVDLNGDGLLDLLCLQGSSLGTLLGYGNGTFQSSSYSLPYPGSGVAAGDFNGDGMVDVVVADASNNTVSILLGGAITDLNVAVSHGSGFTQGQSGLYSLTVSNVGDVSTSGAVGVTDTLPSGFTAASISGAGWTCTLLTLVCSRSDTLAAGASYPPIQINVTAGSQAGAMTDSATVSGGGDGNSANNSGADTTNVRYSTSVSLTSSPNPSMLGEAVTLTATVGSGTGNMTFYDGVTILGIAPVTGGHADLTTTLLPSGARSLTARYDGDSNYGPVLSGTRVQAVTAVASNGAQPKLSFKVGVGPNSVAVADFNRDGRPDVVTGNQNDVSVLLGNGDGTFQPPISVSSPGYLSGVAAGDFNGDGKPDLVIGYQNTTGGASFSVLLGNGDGTFQSPVPVGSISGIYSLAGLVVKDLDRNGTADVLVLSSMGITAFLGNSDGTFQPPLSNSSTSIATQYWSVTDMNNDGIPDIVFTNGSYGPNVSVMRGNGDGTFQPPTSYSGYNTYIMAFSTGDFNGDGKQDVAELYWVGIATMNGNGDGSLQAPVSMSINAPGTPPGYTATTGDFNGDGKLDVLYSNYASGGATLLFGNGDGTFQPVGTTLPTDGTPGGLAFADLNGDGRPDIIVGNNSTSTINVYLGGQYSGLRISSAHYGRFTAGGTASYQISVSNPAFAQTLGTVTATDALPAGLTATSMSGNGWTCSTASVSCQRSDTLTSGTSYPAITLTVAVAGTLSPSTITNQVSVSYGGVTNPATDATAIVLPSTSVLSVSANPVPLGQSVTLTATVTGSGRPAGAVSFFDEGNFLGGATVASGKATLATRLLPAGTQTLTAIYGGDSTHAGSSSPALPLRVNAGAESGLSAPTTYATGAGPNALVYGDFNGDGKIDLATVNSTANTVSVLLGNGDGTFQGKVDYAVGAQPLSLVVGDFNGDGNADLAVANLTGNSLSILVGNGDGTFQTAVSLALPFAASAVAVADLNQDSILDLIVASNGGGQTVLLGNGDGTFRITSNYTCCSNGTPAVVADFNGDGKPDLAFGSYGSIDVTLGNGDGTFGNTLYAGSAYSIAALAAGDLNGDGKLDIVTTDSSGGVDVHLGNGDGTFQNSVYYASGSSPSAVTIGDVNGDGKMDVVVANGAGNTVSVLLGKGDGTMQTQIAYATGSSPHGVVVGDFNGDGRTDIAVANAQSNSISILLGTLTPVLEVSSSHTGNFLFSQTGATYTITVTNGGPGPISGTVTVIDTLPSGLTATAISGSGWSCTLATLTCTQTGGISVGVSPPPITLTVNVASNASSQVTNQVSVTAAGTVPANAGDITSITALPPPVLTAPANGQTGVLSTSGLMWSAADGATSYDVYFGTSSIPPLAGNTAGTTYSPGSLASNTIYYWRVVSKNSAGTATSPTWSFVTGSASSTLAFSVQPAATAAGITMAAVKVQVQDGSGNVLTGSTAAVTVTSSPAGIDATVTAVNGVATFNGLVLNTTGSYTLTATSPGLAPATSNTFLIGTIVPTVVIDSPANGATLTSGSATVSGWALDLSGGLAINSVNVLLDGTLFGSAAYGTSRQDVCAVYPGRPECPNVGFTAALSPPPPDAPPHRLTQIGPGTHVITVSATDAGGNVGSRTTTVTVQTPMTASKAGVFRNNVAFLVDSNGNQTYDAGPDRFIPAFTGPGGFVAGDVPVAGDWTGDGTTKVGLYRASTGTWYLDANNNGTLDAGDYTYSFGGLAGDRPFVGDWTGVGRSCIGIYRSNGSLWLLDLNCNGSFDNTPTDAFFPFGGLPGDVPVVGAWTGGATKVGVVRKYAPGGVPVGNPFFWVPDAGAANAGNAPANHPADVANCFAFGGLTGDVYVTGDWYATGVTGAGVYREGYWVLDAALPGAAQMYHAAGLAFGYGGSPGDVPVVGKW